MLRFHHIGLGMGLGSVLILTGCASALNTAGNAEYGCPGMPLGVLCKTPAAVYRSTHIDPPPTAFDTPIGTTAPVTSQTVTALQAPAPHLDPIAARAAVMGPRPVREPAKVARIWIAPWIDKNDTLHMAQIKFMEITPRTWTIGKAEAQVSTGNVIPHRALERLESSSQAFMPTAPSGMSAPAIPARAVEAARDLVPPN